MSDHLALDLTIFCSLRALPSRDTCNLRPAAAWLILSLDQVHKTGVVMLNNKHSTSTSYSNNCFVPCLVWHNVRLFSAMQTLSMKVEQVLQITVLYSGIKFSLLFSCFPVWLFFIFSFKGFAISAVTVV